MKLLIEGEFTDLQDMIEALRDHRPVQVTIVTDPIDYDSAYDRFMQEGYDDGVADKMAEIVDASKFTDGQFEIVVSILDAQFQ